MTDVAREAGVSVMTVSYVFSRPQRVSPGVRELVVQAARRLNYHGPDPAARSLARGRSNNVGVVVGPTSETRPLLGEHPRPSQAVGDKGAGGGVCFIRVLKAFDEQERVTVAISSRSVTADHLEAYAKPCCLGLSGSCLK